jgi:hypothetical protein
MNNQKIKLFRPMFPDKIAFRRFKKAYTASPLETRIKTIIVAEKIKEKGNIQHLEVPHE